MASKTTTVEESGVSTDEWQYGQAVADRATDGEHDDFKRMSYPFLYFDERDAYDRLTGSTYQRCIECEREMTTGMALDGGFIHADDCPEGDR